MPHQSPQYRTMPFHVKSWMIRLAKSVLWISLTLWNRKVSKALSSKQLLRATVKVCSAKKDYPKKSFDFSHSPSWDPPPDADMTPVPLHLTCPNRLNSEINRTGQKAASVNLVWGVISFIWITGKLRKPRLAHTELGKKPVWSKRWSWFGRVAGVVWSSWICFLSSI